MENSNIEINISYNDNNSKINSSNLLTFGSLTEKILQNYNLMIYSIENITFTINEEEKIVGFEDYKFNNLLIEYISEEQLKNVIFKINDRKRDENGNVIKENKFIDLYNKYIRDIDDLEYAKRLQRGYNIRDNIYSRLTRRNNNFLNVSPINTNRNNNLNSTNILPENISIEFSISNLETNNPPSVGERALPPLPESSNNTSINISDNPSDTELQPLLERNNESLETDSQSQLENNDEPLPPPPGLNSNSISNSITDSIYNRIYDVLLEYGSQIVNNAQLEMENIANLYNNELDPSNNTVPNNNQLDSSNNTVPNNNQLDSSNNTVSNNNQLDPSNNTVSNNNQLDPSNNTVSNNNQLDSNNNNVPNNNENIFNLLNSNNTIIQVVIFQL